MMRIPNNFYIKCNECGNVTLVEADDLDYETSVYDRSMGEEIEYDFRGEICCDKCHSWIDFSIRGYEYPVGAFNFSDSECHGGCFIDEPVVEMDYEFDFDYYDEAYAVGIQCLSPAKKHKLYKSSINKSLHFAQRRLSSSTRGQRVTAQLNLSRE